MIWSMMRVMRVMRVLGLFFCGFWLTSCGTVKPLEVSTYKQRETRVGGERGSLSRAEQNYRLYGYVTEEERQTRVGQYFIIRWEGEEVRGPVTIDLYYRQALTGREVRHVRRKMPDTKGKLEFSIIGEDYRKGGRVLAWKITARQENELLGEKQSYLWQ